MGPAGVVQKHNYNPAGGCLIVFFQLPIFVGLYNSLRVDVELRQAPLISDAIRWCSNLAAPDMLFDWTGFMPAFITQGHGFLGLGPFFNLLPLLTVVLFLWQQQKMMPPPADEQAAIQQNVMKFMMIFIGLMFFKVPSGLCIYFIASSVWSIGERKFLPKPIPMGMPLQRGCSVGETSAFGTQQQQWRRRGGSQEADAQKELTEVWALESSMTTLYRPEDTIAAIASPPGGGRARIVRISGANVRACVERVFRSGCGRIREAARGGRSNCRRSQPIRYRRFDRPGRKRLAASVRGLLLAHQRSFTGEPVEVHTLGSPPLLDAVLRALPGRHFRIAEPGEFTLRAFAGRLDLTQAEAVLGLSMRPILGSFR